MKNCFNCTCKKGEINENCSCCCCSAEGTSECCKVCSKECMCCGCCKGKNKKQENDIDENNK